MSPTLAKGSAATLEKPGTPPMAPLTRLAPSGAPGIGPLQPYPPEPLHMHVSPSGVVNAYALLSNTANSDGFTGAYAFTLGGGGGPVARPGRPRGAGTATTAAAATPRRRSFCSALAQLKCCRSKQQRFYPNV